VFDIAATCSAYCPYLGLPASVKIIPKLDVGWFIFFK
jgi:hypothetical protein